MLAGSGLVVFVLRVVTCEIYDEYEYSDGYHGDGYGDLLEGSPDYGPGPDPGRVRRFGENSASPRNYDDIKDALQKIMVGRPHFRGISQPGTVWEEPSTDVPALSDPDNPDTPLKRFQPAFTAFDPRPSLVATPHQYEALEEVTWSTVLPSFFSFNDTDKTYATLYGLTTGPVTVWYMAKHISPTRSKVSVTTVKGQTEDRQRSTHSLWNTISSKSTILPMRSKIPVRAVVQTEDDRRSTHKIEGLTPHEPARFYTRIVTRSTTRYVTRTPFVNVYGNMSHGPMMMPKNTEEESDDKESEYESYDKSNDTRTVFRANSNNSDTSLSTITNTPTTITNTLPTMTIITNTPPAITNTLSTMTAISNTASTNIIITTTSTPNINFHAMTTSFINDTTVTTNLSTPNIISTITTLSPYVLRANKTTTLKTTTKTTPTKTTNKTTTTKTTTTKTTTTKTTTTKPTTTTTKKPYLVFDIESFLSILANLTYDYYTNLTEVMNATLRNNTPTCAPYDKEFQEYLKKLSSTSTTTTTTTPAYEPPKDLNNTVIAKCYVCGLHSPAVPFNSDCADAFAGDFLPLTPVNPIAKSHVYKYKKYCRYGEIYNFLENVTRPRSLYGRWTGGCSVRWTDLTGLYTQRTCRNRKRAITGRHYASKRMAKLEMSLQHTDTGCIISPVATLLPISRAVSLFARFHACVCTGSWCNGTESTMASVMAVIMTITAAVVWVHR